MKRHPLAVVTAAYFIFLLAGCGALGVTSPQTFNEKAAAATTSVNTASQTVLTLLQSHKITPDESDKYTKGLDETQEAIDFTRTLYKTKPAEAEDRLAATIAALNLVLAELEKRK